MSHEHCHHASVTLSWWLRSRHRVKHHCVARRLHEQGKKNTLFRMEKSSQEELLLQAQSRKLGAIQAEFTDQTMVFSQLCIPTTDAQPCANHRNTWFCLSEALKCYTRVYSAFTTSLPFLMFFVYCSIEGEKKLQYNILENIKQVTVLASCECMHVWVVIGGAVRSYSD